MDQIQIVSWLLTRRCNLRCSYCAISRDYKNIPKEYPRISHYLRNQMSLDFVIDSLSRLRIHNPNCFHILYGGEPMLRQDLSDIVNFCNKQNINYTIITNNSDEVQPFIESLLASTDHIQGLTSSIDPIIFSKKGDPDRVKKSLAGLERLKEYSSYIKDIVAEITVDKDTIKDLYTLVYELTKLGICSDITFIDIAKSPYYDFSNVSDERVLVDKSPEISLIFNEIIRDGLNVHMAKVLLPKIYEILPAELDCEVEKNVHNLTIDADGSVRLCLRIRGVMTPKLKLNKYIQKDGSLNPDLKKFLSRDKASYCRYCNWTCQIMSQLMMKNSNLFNDLVHTKVREL